MTYTYQPRGVCSRKMTVQLQDGIIRDVRVEGGCNGNLQGISRLVIGMPARDAIERMKGIRLENYRITERKNQNGKIF